MKKAFAILFALTLLSASALGAAHALGGISVSLDSYEPGKIEDVDVEPLSDINVNLGGYETHDIESVGVEPLSDINVGLGGYETHDIESVDVEPLSDINVSLHGYETHEIESVDVAPLTDISVNLYPYETHEIENVDVEPLTDIKVAFPEYDMPDLTGIVAPELEPFYVELAGYLGDVDRGKLAALSDIEVADIVSRQYGLISDLNAAFLEAGLNVYIDPVSGTIPIDSTLLYATDQYAVTDTGKAVLSEVFRVYCSVLSREEYREFVSTVRIIGHTDTDGSYEYNQKLSERRAEAVRNFCLSDACGVADVDWLSSRLVAEGHSYDELVYNADGTENKAASRRVEIGFTIAIG